MYKLYSLLETRDTIFECWGASTHHPDSRFHFSDFNKSPYALEWMQIFPWLLECASRMVWMTHTKTVADFAMECYQAMLEARRIEIAQEIEKNS